MDQLILLYLIVSKQNSEVMVFVSLCTVSIVLVGCYQLHGMVHKLLCIRHDMPLLMGAN